MCKNYYMNATLDRERLRRTAPSVFATRPYEGMSERYRFIHTSDKAKPFDFIEARMFLMASFEIGDMFYHVLTDHGHPIREIVLGE
jgi:hypothetical protein